jgi:hypothetical protein
MARGGYCPRTVFPSDGLYPSGLYRIDQRYPAMRTTICLAPEKTDAASMHAVLAALDNNLEREGMRVIGSRSKADFRYGRDQHC